MVLPSLNEKHYIFAVPFFLNFSTLFDILNLFCEDSCTFAFETFSVRCVVIDSYYFYYCFVIEEDGEAVPGGEECAEGVPPAAGLWFLVGQAFG